MGGHDRKNLVDGDGDVQDRGKRGQTREYQTSGSRFEQSPGLRYK